MQVMRNLLKLETVRGRQRQDQRILGRGGLQLEVELPAEALAQRQPPGTVDAGAEGRMQQQLHAAGLIEETLQYDGIHRGQAAPAPHALR